MRPFQFGVVVEDGCTQVVQTLQHLLTLPPAPGLSLPPAVLLSSPPGAPVAVSVPAPGEASADPTPRPYACLSVDIPNAFNSACRSVDIANAFNPGFAAHAMQRRRGL